LRGCQKKKGNRIGKALFTLRKTKKRDSDGWKVSRAREKTTPTTDGL